MGGRQREKTDDIQIILIGDKQGDKGGGGGGNIIWLWGKNIPPSIQYGC